VSPWLLGAWLLAQVPFEVDGFTRPLQVHFVSAETCASCHPARAREWAASSHRASLTNRVFLDGFSVEPQRRCLVCHVPLASQVLEATRHVGALVRGQVPAGTLHEGITCVTCHVRGGVVAAPSEAALPYAHPLRHEPALRTSAFCATCHEFTGHSVVDGKTVLNEFAVQTTFTEWKTWGGAQSCQDCHMKSASHRVVGAHDTEFLRSALALVVDGRVATVTAKNVGHEVPTGDVFRHLVLWADDEVLQVFGLELELGIDANGQSGVFARKNTRLKPDVPVSVTIPPRARVVRLTYHFTSSTARPRPLLTREDELVLVHEVMVARHP
jgi:hypothetical protein